MVKGIGNVNKCRIKNGTISKNRQSFKNRKKKQAAQKFKKKRQDAIKDALESKLTTKNLVKQNRTNPNANLLMSKKKRRLMMRNIRINERDKSRMELAHSKSFAQKKKTLTREKMDEST